MLIFASVSGLSASVNENVTSIKGNTKSLSGLSQSINENAASIKGNTKSLNGLSRSVNENAKSVNQLSVKGSHAAYQ